MVPWWPPVLDSPTRVNILPMVSLSGSFVSFYISMKMYIFFKFQKIQQIPRCCLNCWIFLTLPIFCFELMVSLFLKSCACANQACHADPTSLALTTHYTDQEAYFTGNNCHEAISTCCFFHSHSFRSAYPSSAFSPTENSLYLSLPIQMKGCRPICWLFLFPQIAP